MADRINFNHPINDSAQVGDILYFASVSPVGESQTNSPITEIGPITAIGKNFVEVDGNAPANFTQQQIETGFVTVQVVDENGDPGTASVPVAPPLFMFRKNAKANVSTLLGYFANVKITNSTNQRAELYSVGSEIFLSSK